MVFELRWPGAEIVSTGTGQKGIEMVGTESPEVVILDVGLPDMNGFDVLRQIRLFSNAPTIILTGRAIDEIDKVKGFAMEADDYIVKPLSPGEFLARVKNVLAHRRISSNQVYTPPLTLGDLVVDFVKRRVSLGDDSLDLTVTEYNLLCHLAKSAGKVLSYENILTTVWGERYDDVNILKSCVYRLRQKLVQAGAKPDIIASERGFGYKFAYPL